MIEDGVDILLVEDNLSDAELALDALREHKLRSRVHLVRNGAAALDFIFHTGDYANRPHQYPRLILLDLKLPKVNGFQVLERIRADPRTTILPVVVFTSSREERDIVESYRLHVNSYIVKPLSSENFTEAVHHLGLYWLLLNQPPTT